MFLFCSLILKTTFEDVFSVFMDLKTQWRYFMSRWSGRLEPPLFNPSLLQCCWWELFGPHGLLLRWMLCVREANVLIYKQIRWADQSWQRCFTSKISITSSPGPSQCLLSVLRMPDVFHVCEVHGDERLHASTRCACFLMALMTSNRDRAWPQGAVTQLLNLSKQPWAFWPKPQVE